MNSDLRRVLKDAIRDRRWPIYLYGETGTGKTCAAACVYVAWPSPSAMWCEAATLISDAVSVTFRGEIPRTGPDGQIYSITSERFFAAIESADLLVIDDIGLRAPSNPQYEAFYRIVNLRAGKLTIYTGNLDPEGLASLYDCRIASRICAGQVIEVTGEDRRLKNLKIIGV